MSDKKFSANAQLRPAIVLEERDESGQISALYSTDEDVGKKTWSSWMRIDNVESKQRFRNLRSLLRDMFLPAEYPATVPPDYLPYQIYNALQAFCSSLAGLLASRAVLEGHGVGDPTASATYAILLTVFQDVFSRLTTIAGAYYLGTSLFPEAKTYRLLADILNDAAIILDSLSPYFASFSLSIYYPFVRRGRATYLRIASLCLSGSFRALCGVAAGGSKAALTMHFGSSGRMGGDVGDLNAKDASKETVLGLLGMLCGSIVMQYVQTSQATYAILFFLVFCHLAVNYVGVRVVVMRTFNRQRARIVWNEFIFNSKTVLTPEETAARERIFANPTSIGPRNTCFLGSSFSCIIPKDGSRTNQFNLTGSQIKKLSEVFMNERYIIWFDANTKIPHQTLHVCLKQGHGPLDHLKGWIHAQQVVARVAGHSPSSFDARLLVISDTLGGIEELFPTFIKQARTAGWRVGEGALLAGSPKTISVRIGNNSSTTERFRAGQDEKQGH